MVATWIWMAALLAAGLAAWIDYRSRKIPNWLTVPGLAVGLAINSVAYGWRGAQAALIGAAVCLILLLPFVLLRGLGAGDWKLMAALGALLGPRSVLLVLAVAILIAGFMGLVQMVVRGRVRQTLQNLRVLVYAFLTFRPKTHPDISLENPHALKLPFGVAVAAATLISFATVQGRLHWGL